MSKRKSDFMDCDATYVNKLKAISTDCHISYVVIETTDEKGAVFVQFVPYSWLIPLKPNLKIIARAQAQFYYPRRLAGQTIDQHSKFVKNAKFMCMPPQNDWQLLKCRVLTIGLGKNVFQLWLC